VNFLDPKPWADKAHGFFFALRLAENTHLRRYPHLSSLRRTNEYASYLEISDALHLDIFHQPQNDEET
jgi:hypothetical protein